MIASVFLGDFRSCGRSTTGPAADFGARRDGYSFHNPEDFITSDDFNEWKLVFGDDPASSWALYEASVQESHGAGVFSGGLCYGMVGTALSMFNGWTSAANFPQQPKAKDVYAIRPGATWREFGNADATVRGFVERFYLAQFLPDVDEATVYGSEPTYGNVHKALATGDRKLPILIITTDTEDDGGPGGHALLPVGVDEPDPAGHARILVWDTNHPGVLRWLQISTRTWAWSYDLGRDGAGKEMVWTSRHGQLGYVPIRSVVEALGKTPGGANVEVRHSGGHAPFIIVPLTIVSGADAAFHGSSGGVLGFVHGRLRDSLPGARYVYPDALSGRSAVDRFVVPVDQAIRRTVTCRRARPYQYSIITSAGAAAVTGQPGKRVTDKLDVGRGVASVVITAGGRERECAVSLTRFADSQARAMTVTPTGLGTKESFTVAAAEKDQAVRVVNGDRPRTYRVTLSSFGKSGGFTSGPISIGAGESQIVKAYDWSHLGDSQIDLIRGSSGAEGTPSVTVLRPGSRSATPGHGFSTWLAMGIAVVAAAAGVGVVLLRLRRRPAA